MKGKPQNLWKTLSRLMRYMGRYTRRFALVGILAAFSACTNLFGTYMIKPIVNQAADPGSGQLWISIALMAGIYILGVISAYGYTQLMVYGAQKVVRDIRSDLFHHVNTLPLQVFDTTSHGDLMARFTSDVDTVSDALNNSFAMVIQSFVQAVGTLILLFVLNWQLSLIVLVFYVLMMIYILAAGRISRKYFSRQQKFIGSLNGFVEEMIQGMRVVKVFGHEQANAQSFAKYNQALSHASETALSFSQTMVPAVVSLSYINYAIVAVAGGYMALAGMTSVGALASYLVFVRQAAMPINQFVQQSNLVLAALAGAERIFNFMELQPEVDDGRVTLAYGKKTDTGWTESETHTGHWVWKHPRENGKVEYVPLQGDVRFEQVHFGYTPEKEVLKDISLYAKPGQTIALVGSTGAGKTTVTNLLNRFYDIQSGSILYDGIDIKLIRKEDLRRSLAMVLQDTHLFTGTIMENIRYGNLKATDEEVIAAARLANADGFIRRLPQGYQTVITGDGSSLSQGQRQLLSIARAAVANPPVLVLDEATSSIDTRTERLVEKGMNALMDGRTTFVIAHRLSTVRNADCIVVLEGGKIMEKGSHQELLDKKGIYYQLYSGMFELS